MSSKLVTLLDEFADVCREVSVLCVVVITFWDELSISKQYCFGDEFVCFVYVCGGG